MEREQVLLTALQAAFGDALLVAVDPPNAGGLTFTEMPEWRPLVHPAEMVVMADALNETAFGLFVTGIVLLIGFTLAELAVSGDVDDAILAAQALTAEKNPAAYAVLDAVFYL